MIENRHTCAKDQFGFVQKQVPDRRRISNPMTLTLSRPTGEGTARYVACTFYSSWIGRLPEDDSPSPIRYLFSGSGCRAATTPPRAAAERLARSARFAGSLRAAGRGATRRSATSSTSLNTYVGGEGEQQLRPGGGGSAHD